MARLAIVAGALLLTACSGEAAPLLHPARVAVAEMAA